MTQSNNTSTAEVTQSQVTMHTPASGRELSSEQNAGAVLPVVQRAANVVGSSSPQTPPKRFNALLNHKQSSTAMRAGVLRQLQRRYGNSYVGQVIQRRTQSSHASANPPREKIHRRAEDETSSPSVAGLDALQQSGAGQRLDSSTRSSMESRFGHDFADVMIHSDKDAAEAAQQIDAQAFTAGRDIYFGAGRFQPDTYEGQKLLAHELTHVVQQRGQAGSPPGHLLSGPNDPAEQEAERISGSYDRQSLPTPTALPAAMIHRQPKPPGTDSTATPAPDPAPAPDKAPDKQPAMQLADVLSLYEASIMHLKELEGKYDDLGLSALILDLGFERDLLKDDPATLPESQQIITRHDGIRANVERVLPALDELLKGEFPESSKADLVARLKEIREGYVSALRMSLDPSATSVFNKADKDMRFFPTFVSITILQHGLDDVMELGRIALGLPQDASQAGVYLPTLRTEFAMSEALDEARKKMEEAYAKEDADPAAAKKILDDLQKKLARYPLGLKISAEFERAFSFQQELYKSDSAFFGGASVTAMNLVNELIVRLKAIEEKYRAGDPTAEAEFNALTSSPRYKEFYEQYTLFMRVGEKAFKLYTLALSATTGGAVGSMTSGFVGLETGFALTAGNALRVGGVALAESLAFTTTERMMGFTGSELADPAKFGKEFAKDVLWGTAMFGGLRVIGRQFAIAGKALEETPGLNPAELAKARTLLKAKEIATNIAALEAFGIARMGVEKGRFVTGVEAGTMAVENIVLMGALGIVGKVNEPLFADLKDAGIQARFRKSFGSRVDAVQARQDALSMRVLKSIQEGTLNNDVLKEFVKERTAIDAEVQKIVQEAQAKQAISPKHFEKVLSQLKEGQASLEYATLVSGAGLKSLGADSYSYDYNTGEHLKNYYAGRATVEEVATETGRGLRVTLPDGEVVIFVERPKLELSQTLTETAGGEAIPREKIGTTKFKDHPNRAQVEAALRQENAVIETNDAMKAEADTAFIRITGPNGASFTRIIIRYNPAKCTILNMMHEVNHIRDFQSGKVEPNFQAQAKDMESFEQLQKQSAEAVKKFARENSLSYLAKPIEQAAEFRAVQFLAEISTHLKDVEFGMIKTPTGYEEKAGVMATYEHPTMGEAQLSVYDLESGNVKGQINGLRNMLSTGKVEHRSEVLNEAQRGALRQFVLNKLDTAFAGLAERYTELIGGANHSLKGKLGL